MAKIDAEMGMPNVGAFANPLEGWPNDDICLSEESRAYIHETQPALLRVLDWPELRDEFNRHNTPGLAAKKRNRLTGFIAIYGSAIGLMVAAIAPLFPETKLLWIASEILLATGVVLGAFHFWLAKHKSRWLGHRFWTERLRQLYFQFLIANIDLAAKAIDESDAKEEYDAARKQALKVLLQQKKDTSHLLEELVSDVAETSPWIDVKWRSQAKNLSKTKNTELLLSILERQRIGVQEEYVQKKIRAGFHSPISRANFLASTADLCTFLVVALGFVAGYLFFQHDLGAANVWVKLCLASSAVLSAAILLLRILDEALCLRISSERYKWYLAATRDVRARFQGTNKANEKVRILKEMEQISYQELRRFIACHKAARFLL